MLSFHSPFSFSVGCIWQFNGCVEERSDEGVCYERFDECKMIIMGMQPQQVQQPIAQRSPVAGKYISVNRIRLKIVFLFQLGCSTRPRPFKCPPRSWACLIDPWPWFQWRPGLFRGLSVIAAGQFSIVSPHTRLLVNVALFRRLQLFVLMRDQHLDAAFAQSK